MKNRALIPLAIGLVVGLIAVKYSVDVVKKARASSTSEDMLHIVVAQQPIPMGVELKATMLSVTRTSRNLAPQGSFEDPKKLVGRVVRSPIPKGLPVIEEMLAAPGTPPGMASLVPAGYRAVAVKVDEFSSVGGFIKPGCRVDVAATMSVKGPTGTPQTISRVILQDVTVGAVGQSLTGEVEAGPATVTRSVTLIVKPEEVPILHLSATQGQIRLALRHYDDASQVAASTTNEDELTGAKPVAAKEPTESFLSILAKMFETPQAKGPAPRQAWPKDLTERNKLLKVHNPYVMTVISGSAVQSVAFQDGSSTKRVDANTLPHGSAMASAGGRQDMPTREPARPEPVEEQTPEFVPAGE